MNAHARAHTRISMGSVFIILPCSTGYCVYCFSTGSVCVCVLVSSVRVDQHSVMGVCFPQVYQGLLCVLYNLGDGDYNLTLPLHRLDDGEWHLVELDRSGREFTLRLDGGGGGREASASAGRSQELIIDPSVVMLGNALPSAHNHSFLGREGGGEGGRD